MSANLHFFSKTFFLPLMASLLASACSSGGSGGESSRSSTGGFSEVSVSEIQGPQQRYEGETVTLSLDVGGEAANNLTFSWTLSGDVPFQGQGTSVITFVAPEVDGVSVVSVRVEAGLKNGTLLGDGERMASVQILDIDPANILAEGFQTTLPDVDSLNLSMLDGAALISVESFERSDVVLAGKATRVQRVARGSATVEMTANDINVRLCGALGAVPMDGLINPNLDCGPEASAFKYFQSGAQLRSEVYCGEEIVYAINIRGTDIDPRARQGQVLFDVDDSETLQDSMNACVERVDVLLTRNGENPTSPANYVSEAASRYRVEVPQPSGPFVFEIIGDKIISSFATFKMNEIFNPNGAISATIIAPNNTDLDGLKANDGSVTIYNLDAEEYEVDLDLYFETESDPRMQIRAESMLYLP